MPVGPRAFIQAAPAIGNDEEIERKVAVRATRGQLLTSDEPPEFWAVLNEAVIRRVAGGSSVLREQLSHIAEMAKLPHVTVQVLPPGCGHRHPGA